MYYLEVGVSVVTRTRFSCVNCKCGVTISFVGPALEVGVNVGTGTKCCSRSKHRFAAPFPQTLPELVTSLKGHLALISARLSVCLLSVCMLSLIHI